MSLLFTLCSLLSALTFMELLSTTRLSSPRLPSLSQCPTSLLATDASWGSQVAALPRRLTTGTLQLYHEPDNNALIESKIKSATIFYPIGYC